MKRVLIVISFLSSLFADVETILPYGAFLDYSSASEKEDGVISGAYFSRGSLDYLLEVDLSATDIKYKSSSTASDIKQNNFVLIYSEYFEKYMLKGGIHTIDTTDTDLGDGLMMTAALGRHSFGTYIQKSFGLEGYYTFYKDGEFNDRRNGIHVFQLTPYFNYSKSLDLYRKNSFSLKANYIYVPRYFAKDYISFEFSDTLYYGSFYTSIGVLAGNMKNGVRDGGFTVYNSKDELNAIYSLKIGYYFSSTFDMNFKYALTEMMEAGVTKASNSAAVLALSYQF